MRSLYYKELVDNMTVASFVKSQVLTLNVIDIISYLFFTKPYLNIDGNLLQDKTYNQKIQINIKGIRCLLMNIFTL